MLLQFYTIREQKVLCRAYQIFDILEHIYIYIYIVRVHYNLERGMGEKKIQFQKNTMYVVIS